MSRDVTRVNLVFVALESLEAPGGRRIAGESGVPAHELRVVPGAVLGSVAAGKLADLQGVILVAPYRDETSKVGIPIVRSDALREVRSPALREPTVYEKGGGPIGVSAGVERRDSRGASAPAVDRGALDSGRVHDGDHVVHARFQGRRERDAVGHAGPTPIEIEHADAFGEAIHEARELRQLPVHLEMRVHVVREDEGERTRADIMVCDPHAVDGLGPAGLGHTRIGQRDAALWFEVLALIAEDPACDGSAFVGRQRRVG